MAKISAARVEPTNDSQFEKRQILRVKSGLYGGMFAWYSLPKMYRVVKPKPGKPDQEERFYVGFVLTHDRAGNVMPHFSDATMGIRTKRFYDETTGMKSSYVALLHALSAGKLSLNELVSMDDDDLPDLDDYIGRPSWLFIEEDNKPSDDGLYGRRVKSLEPMDKGLWEASKQLYNGKETQHTDKGVVRLVKPTAAYEDEVGKGGAVADGNPFDEGDELEIPF